ncbi:hypothetical protein Gohar_024377, partial [Gossypium harknessii]|nr:hypothetical protein [Gossypium harknessii]
WGILDGVTLTRGRIHDRIVIQIDNMEEIKFCINPVYLIAFTK